MHMCMDECLCACMFVCTLVCGPQVNARECVCVYKYLHECAPLCAHTTRRYVVSHACECTCSCAHL